MAKRRQRTEHNTPALSVIEQRNEIFFLLRFYEPFATKTIIVFLIMMVSNSMSLVLPGVIGRLFDTILAYAMTESGWLLIGGMVLLFVVQSVLNYFTSVTLATITQNVLTTLRTTLFAHIIRLPMAYFAEKRVGELLSRVTSDITQIQETFTFTMLQLLRQGIFLVGGTAFILVRSVELTKPVLVCVPILIVVAITLGKKLRAISTKAQDAIAQATTIVEESFQAIESVKSFTNEQHETSRYTSKLNEYVALALRGVRIQSLFVSFILFAAFGGIAGVLGYGVYLVHLKELSIGELISFVMYSFFVAGAMGSFAELYGQIQRTLGASVRVREILSEKAETDDIHQDSSPKLDTISFRNVSFAYPSRPDLTVLNDVTFDICAGERVAFVGESGAGKSTTASLIQRMYTQQSGEILFNNIPVSTLTLAHVRSSIGVVPQDIILFGTTIEDNIRYGKLNASSDDIIRASKTANADEFIAQFPDGMATMVGERGVKLSGGQRQRIAIARAILKNPPILILDEATSSLDSETEHLIQQALDVLMHGRTTVIIAHRLATIRRCDRIFVFKNGRIVQQGTHDELISQSDSYYARLCELQFGRNRNDLQ
ncbi:MAG: ABC transporter ATP-binding protein [Candidatus Kapabacteria bacterium]|nr:ABC transporter ATP-binding protein [Candidatus Kapabacteria bacterium]